LNRLDRVAPDKVGLTASLPSTQKWSPLVKERKMNNDTGIYSITSPSGNFYIGSASSFRRRWKKHIEDLRAGKHHSVALQRAFYIYGESSLRFEKLALCPITDLIVVEQRYIDQLTPAYNCCPKAGSTQGLKIGPFSEEHRSKISAAQKGRPRHSSEMRAQIGDQHRGKKLSDTHIQSMRDKFAGAGNPFYGRKHSEETILRMSGANHHSARSVICIETGICFSSVTAAAKWVRQNGRVSASRYPIIQCCKGSTRYSRPYGYTWKYHEADCNSTRPEMLEE
jgi:group I intron endonuclease